ncbi:DNA-protecting protein DprA [Candidatus Shapirobacteria bacterium]|nr:MAG: DNA-protecting protein DprA [Candidatus Shapirobacteria bacterium]
MKRRVWKKWPIKQIEISNDNYPLSLKKIKKPPQKLFYRGEWHKGIFDKSLAIVGSRKMSSYGQRVIERLMPDLVKQGVVIISGFMYGVDSWSHQSCLDLGGITVAVLGNGLDVLYPARQDKLYEEILKKGGLIISEYEKNQAPALWTFPQRNRIVAGLSSLGTLVVEAGLKSGSLITARITKEQGKKLWAVPGGIDVSVSKGTNWLIKAGQAKMLTEVSDILAIDKKDEESAQMDWLNQLSPAEKEVIECLEVESMSLDELSRKIGKSVSQLSVLTSMMEMEGKIREDGGKFYQPI